MNKKSIAAIIMTALIIVMSSSTSFASDYAALQARDTHCNMDMPKEVYEAAYNTLMAHAGDAASATPQLYDFGAGYTGVQGEYMARLLNRLLGTTDIIVLCDNAGYSSFKLTSSGYIEKLTRQYHTYGSGSGKRGLKIGYCCNVEPAAAAEKIRALRKTAEGIAGSAPSGASASVRAFDSSICSRCSYDRRQDGFANSEIATAYGCLIRGLAVCDGYADAMTLLCYLKGIPCYSISCIKDGDLHGMNAIYVDGRYVWSDSTYSDGGRDSVLYKDVTEESFKNLFDYVPAGAAPHWEKDGGNWTYVDASGRKMTGWIQDNGYWYFLGSDGNMATGRITDAGADYYLNDGFTDRIPLGAMCVETILPDGSKAGHDGRIGEY